MSHLEPRNPFRASQLRPGRIPYIFAGQDGFEAFLQRWQENGFQGAVVGPHGSGKSTLLFQAEAWASSQGWKITRFRVRPDSRWLPGIQICLAIIRLGRQDILSVDGFEQVPGVLRWLQAGLLRVFPQRILVTSHQPTPLATLIETMPTPQQAGEVIRAIAGLDLARPREIQPWSQAMLAEALHQHHGSIREIMFGMYDDLRNDPAG